MTEDDRKQLRQMTIHVLALARSMTALGERFTAEVLRVLNIETPRRRAQRRRRELIAIIAAMHESTR